VGESTGVKVKGFLPLCSKAKTTVEGRGKIGKMGLI